MQDTKLKDLLRSFDISDQQLKAIYQLFCNEICKGLSKDTHPCADIKCFVTYVQDLPTGEEVGKYLALDLGGTNFRVLLVELREHREAKVSSQIYALPQEIMLGSGEQLFDHIAQCLATFVEERGLQDERLSLGFTFSFPCLQLGLTKALLVRWTKGFKCSGVEEHDVVNLLRAALRRRGGDLAIDVVAVLNDTTGTLMSCAHRNSECRIGVIIGTGCNACYVERVSNVDMLQQQYKLDKEHVIINTEWGAFGDSGTLEFIRNDFDREMDRSTLNVHHQIFEKMISGMYLGQLVQLVLLSAIENNLIFKNSTRKEEFIKLLNKNANQFETRYISAIEADVFPHFDNTQQILKQLLDLEVGVEDCQRLQQICECISQRAAKLVAVGIVGLMNRIDDVAHIVIGVDGSLYRFHPKFDGYVRETIAVLLKPGLSFDIMLSEDGSGCGAALVAAVASRTIHS